MKAIQKTSYITMERTYEVFIPFVEENVSKDSIEKMLLNQNFGQIVDITLNDKKIKSNGRLRSARHKFAFIKLFIFNTVQGNNMIYNIKTNKTTHISSIKHNTVIKLDIKPYLSISERASKGFELHVKQGDRSFYDNIIDKKLCEDDYNEIEKELNKYYIPQLYQLQ